MVLETNFGSLIRGRKMFDLMQKLQDPEFVEQMTNGPAQLSAQLTNIENQLAELLQICKSADWYLEAQLKTPIERGITTTPPVGEDSPIG
jgi:predicted nuclease of restriction endonuclease-like RecB superfamily